VDPQLKNNPDLIEALQEYEGSWEKGKDYFLREDKLQHLLSLSHFLEITGEKYPDFQTQIDCRDSDLFLNIPYLVILKCLVKEDSNICSFFLPQMFTKGHKTSRLFEELQRDFDSWQASRQQ